MDEHRVTLAGLNELVCPAFPAFTGFKAFANHLDIIGQVYPSGKLLDGPSFDVTISGMDDIFNRSITTAYYLAMAKIEEVVNSNKPT